MRDLTVQTRLSYGPGVWGKVHRMPYWKPRKIREDYMERCSRPIGAEPLKTMCGVEVYIAEFADRIVPRNSAISCKRCLRSISSRSSSR